jgi:glycosyltransferase involved in cell wall biosynthesis
LKICSTVIDDMQGIPENLRGKKVLLVITKSNWGGAQVYVYQLATHLKSLGIDVAVALGGTGLPGSEAGLLHVRLEEAHIRVIPLPSMARDISIVQEIKAFTQLYKIIKIEKPDILHLNSSKSGVLGSIAGRLAHVRNIIFTAHGWPHREKRTFFMRLIIWIGSWITVIFSHTVIAVSKCDVETSPRIFSRRNIHLIHNEITQYELLSKEIARTILSEKYSSLKLFPRWILMVGELHPNKGIDIAIQAFATISTKYPDVALVIIGKGSERERLEKMIHDLKLSEHIFLLGFIPDSRKFLCAGDCFILTSYKEGLPFVLLEAGLAKLPTIATYTGGIPEIIEDSKNGLLTEPGDVSQTVHALEKILDNPFYAENLGYNLYKTVIERFSQKEMFEKTFKLYN